MSSNLDMVEICTLADNEGFEVEVFVSFGTTRKQYQSRLKQLKCTNLEMLY